MTDVTRPDMHSYANFKEIMCTNLDINLSVNFEKHFFEGSVEVSAKVLDKSATKMYLDVQLLDIKEISDVKSKEKLNFLIGHKGEFGQELVIDLPANNNGDVTVRIQYATHKDAPAIQWLDAAQTTGGQHPFVFTQSQAIQARSLLPCMDTPSVKCPFSCTVTVPRPLFAVASGLPQGDPVIDEANNTISYSYHQPMPVMIYLFAICVGNLKRESIGPRSNIYCEPEMMKGAQWELDGITEEFIVTAQSICGTPYLWQTYDVVILPRSFAYGGMENPNATFMSSALLAGDRSLTTTLAHEITHSWCGNLVTNGYWKDFWLNEGFTRYVERRILGSLHGNAYRGLLLKFGYFELIKNVGFLKETPGLTRLNPDLTGLSPDDAFSRIPYEKGSLFLYYLEHQVGGEEMMSSWLTSYFTDFAEKSIETEDFKNHFIEFFENKKVDLSHVDWEHWLQGEGLPDFDLDAMIDHSMIDRCRELATMWNTNQGAGTDPKDFDGMKAHQVMVCLDNIINDAKPMSAELLKKMDDTYNFSTSGNVEIAFRWFLLCLRNNYQDNFKELETYLSSNGRGVYVKPLYTELAKVDLKTAQSIYAKNAGFYMEVVGSALKKICA